MPSRETNADRRAPRPREEGHLGLEVAGRRPIGRDDIEPVEEPNDGGPDGSRGGSAVDEQDAWRHGQSLEPPQTTAGAGERSDALEVHGYDIRKVRYLATVTGGALAGVGGAHVSIAYANSWFEGMIAGRGFIAVALVIFAMWNPLTIMGGAYLFGAALSLASVLQAAGVAVNQFALAAVPFLLTLAVLAALGRRTLRAAPDELLKVLDNSTAS